jgi:predicted transcriptional regulator
MQVTISLSPDIASVLRALAWRECRSPQQQAKWLLTQALDAAAKQECLPEAEPSEGASALAAEVLCVSE